jgi:DNA-binding response OmpR family regulator
MRILLLEDNPDDADLLAIALAGSGLAFDLHRATGEEEFAAALEAFAPDIVVSDANIPGFPYRKALALARETRPQLAFVVVSGIDERDLPARDLPHGADAWVCKDRMERVAPVLRELAVTARAMPRAPDVREREA